MGRSTSIVSLLAVIASVASVGCGGSCEDTATLYGGEILLVNASSIVGQFKVGTVGNALTWLPQLALPGDVKNARHDSDQLRLYLMTDGGRPVVRLGEKGLTKEGEHDVAVIAGWFQSGTVDAWLVEIDIDHATIPWDCKPADPEVVVSPGK